MYSNHGNIELPLAVWLAADDGYDLKYDPNVISATTTMSPPRSVILSRRLEAQMTAGTVDLDTLVAARVGSAVHSAAENSWLHSLPQALKNLNIPQHIADRIWVNPPRHADIPEDSIPIYLEQRAQKQIGKWWVSGKFDFVYEGRVRDIKTTKTYNWILGGNDKKYALQGSIYRWLNPDIITDDSCSIEFLFTDWSPLKQMLDKSYPPKRIMTKVLPLLSIEETEAFLIKQLTILDTYMESKQEDMPKCTPEELWMKPTKYAYYKSAKATARATKLFDTMHEATARMVKDGNTGKILPRIAEPKFCHYCDARPICMQAAQFIEDGILKL